MKKVLFSLVLFGMLLLGLTGCSDSGDKYEFDFNDNGEPGVNYKGSINLETGKSKIEIDHGCTLPNPSDCGQLHFEYKGTLDSTQLEKVNKILEKTNHADSPYLIMAISEILEGDKICIEETNEKCVDIGNQGLDDILNGLE